MRDPRLRRAAPPTAPFKIGGITHDVIVKICYELIYHIHAQPSSDISGDAWARMFANALGVPYSNSKVGLADVWYNRTCWGVKTVINAAPSQIERVRLICGRNALTYSYSVDNARGLKPHEIGELVLGIWNARVEETQQTYNDTRMIVLARSKDLSKYSLFEFPMVKYDYREYFWGWNRGNNLEGHNSSGVGFTWQPHEAQFTLQQPVPEGLKSFEIRLPPPLSKETALQLLGVGPDWVTIG